MVSWHTVVDWVGSRWSGRPSTGNRNRERSAVPGWAAQHQRVRCYARATFLMLTLPMPESSITGCILQMLSLVSRPQPGDVVGNTGLKVKLLRETGVILQGGDIKIPFGCWSLGERTGRQFHSETGNHLLNRLHDLLIGRRTPASNVINWPF